MKKLLLFAALCGTLLTSDLYAQPGCPAVSTASNVTVPCGQTCTDLTAFAVAGAQTTSYSVDPIPYSPPFSFNSGTPILVNTDDLWSGVINLPFRFCFYGTGYTQIIVGSNGVCSFNTANAGGFNNWNIPGPIPSTTPADLMNSIMGPWQDIDPTNQGQIFYELGGTAPCRYFKVSWYNTPYYGAANSISTGSCPGQDLRATQQIILYETTNLIDIYIQQKQTCASWNGGLAIEGIQNANGTQAVSVPGRNATQWTATNSAHRFTPQGAVNYTIAWFQGATQIGTGNTINVCPSGTTVYTAKATYNSCGVSGVEVSSDVTVSFSGTSAQVDSVHQVSCHNGTDGAVYGSYNSGSSVISYGWSPGGAGQTSLTNIGPGTYIFSVTDAANCTRYDTVTLVNPPQLTVNVDDVSVISCLPGATGTLTATAGGGTPGYSYQWTGGGSTTSTLTTTAGTYTVTVTDSKNCTASDPGTITVTPSSLAFNAPVIVPATCTASNGSISTSLSGATGTVTYTWSPVLPNNANQTGLAAGSYSVTATDVNGCSASAQYTVGSTGSISFNAPTITDAICTASNGSITVNVVGASGTVNYTWSPAQPNSATASGLAPGVYSVTAVDANGCSTSASYNVNQTGGISFGAPTIVDATCTAANGSITVAVIGASGNVDYTWSPAQTNSATASNLASGSYSVTAVDANGCSATATYNVGQTGGISFGAPTITDATCGGSNGSITVAVVGATGTVDYTWSPAQPNSASISGLAAGSYSVTAIDANGCSATAAYSVAQTGAISFGAPAITDATCGGSNGSITVNVIGATGTVDYTWSPAQANSASITGLAAGVYSVTAVDGACSATASYTVGQTGSISFGAPVITDASCGNAGSIVVNVIGGATPVTYTWSPNVSSTDSATNLTAGVYHVTAVDNNGCSATASYSVGQGNAIVITNAVVNDVSCTGFGDITITATGGSGTLTYTWSGPGGALSGNPLTNLTAGTFNLTVTDQGTCSATGTYIVGNSICGDCPAVATNNNVTIPCGQACTTLSATAVAGHQTTAYAGAAIAFNPPVPFNTGTPILVSIDDTWSNVINLPFNFCFFGTSYNSLVVGSNGLVSFNVANAGNNNSWQINGPIPSTTPADLRNCIMGPWHDMDPTFQGNIFYNITGTYPCRQFIVSWNQVSLYGDPNSVSPGSCNTAYSERQQIVLYETTNVIDIYIGQKDVCAGWNAGLAVEGIQNAAGTLAYTAPGRNATQWSATNDGYRFTPNGAPNYVINWFQGNTQIGTGDSISVCPSVSTVYNVQAVYTNCDNSTITVADSVIVNVQGGLTATVDSVTNISCAGGNNGAVYASYTSTGGTVTSFGWSPGGANQTSLTGLSAGTYIFSVTNAAGCTVSDTVVLTDPAALTVTVSDTTVYNCVATPVSVSLTATPAGGTPGYTYDWGGGITTPIISGVDVGSYTVTVTDTNGCTATGTGTVTQTIANPAFNQPQITNVTCNGGNDGGIIVSVSQATPVVVYTWSPAQTGNDTLTGLTAGTYDVTATDANGCSVTASYDVTEPTAIVLGNPVITDASCTVGGTISDTATGGTGQLIYVWSNGDTGNFADSLAGGPVSLTVTDANGCSITATFTIGTTPNTVAFGNPVIVDVTCNGGSNGSITATATGGNGPIVFTWANPVSTGPTVSGLPAGTYDVTITDSVGCSASTSYTINEPAAITPGNPVITPATCVTGGTITVTATGGTGTLTYGWSNGDTGNLADSISGGTVTLTVTDANGCSVTASYTVPSSGGITLNTSTSTDITCNGANDGSIHVVAIGASAPVVYTWNPAVSVDSMATGLSAGSYAVTVTDNGGCSASASYTINEPTAITLGNPVITDETCTRGGTVTVTATGGTGTLTYGWSNGDSGTLADSLNAGTVSLTVTDANGCSVTASYTIGSAPNTVALGNATIVDVTCNGGNNGSITATATGGTGTLVFTWNTTPTTTGASITGLTAGAYSVTVTDSLGCSVSATYNVAEPTAITPGQAVITPATCLVGGTVTVTATGGTGLLTYDWSNGDTLNIADSITTGSVDLTVTDANGCSVTATYVVPQSNGINLSTSTFTNITCNGAANGSIHVVATGATAPVVYVWSPAVSIDSLASGLSAGTYNVTVTDGGGCSATASYTIVEPAAIVIGNDTITDATCSQGGSIAVSATGGTGTLVYTWSGTAQTGPSITNLAGGTYILTVSDASNCSATATYNVGATGNTVAFGSPTLTQPTCNGGTNGSITVATTGGTGPIGFTWNPGSSVTATLSGIGAGTYSVTATDSVGCSASTTYTLNQPAAIVVGNPTITPVTCQAGGSITVTATGGTGQLTYAWSNGDTGTTADSLPAGNVTLTVTDGSSCSVSATFVITSAAGSIAIGNPIINNVSCNGANDGSITINPTGGTGSLTSTWSTTPPTNGNTVTGLAPGSYTVVVTDQGACSATATYSITQPAPLAVTVAATPLLCGGATDGTATATVTGGTTNYTYVWNVPGGNTPTVTNLEPNIVQVTVTDANGCTASASATISQSPAISFNSQINQPTCATVGFGTEILTPRGGTGPIRITITSAGLNVDTTLPMTGADTVLVIPQVPTGCYDFTLTDQLTCSITGNFCVNAGAADQVFNTVSTPTSCFGKSFSDGTLAVTPQTADNAPYAYSLDGTTFQADSSFENLTAGTYNVYVTNRFGCLDTVVVTVGEPAQLFVDATPDTIVTGAGVGNQINVTATNYTNPVYTWTPVDGLSCTDCSNPLATVNVNSVFYVVVSESGITGCSASDSVVIIVNGKLKMPNAFSPNGDGKNDGYGPVNGENSALTITAFRIYNRWGQEVHNAAENWDGKFKGEDQPAGTYIYYISVRTPDENNPGQDKTVNDQGAFTLLR